MGTARWLWGHRGTQQVMSGARGLSPCWGAGGRVLHGGVPRGLPGVMLCCWPRPAAPPRDAAGAISTGMSGKEAPRCFFFIVSSPLCQKGLFTSPQTSPCALPMLVSVGRGCEAVPLGLFSSFSFFFPCPWCAFSSHHVHTERSPCLLPGTQLAEERGCHPRAASCQAAWVSLGTGRPAVRPLPCSQVSK